MIVPFFVHKLQSAGLGIAGTSLFSHQMPAQVEKGLLVKAPHRGIPFDHELPGYIKTNIQVIVRDTKHEPGEMLADRVFAGMTMRSEETWQAGPNRILVRRCLPETLPIRYPRSDGNGIEWSINFNAIYIALYLVNSP